MPPELKAQVDPQKPTTKVNITVVLAVLFFFVMTAIIVWRVSQDPPQSSEEVQSVDPVP